MSEFEDKTVLITGGTQGIGLGIAKCFSSEGANVHISGTREHAADYNTSLSDFTYHQADLSKSAGCQSLFNKVPEVDILVNNAGVARDDEFEMDGFRATLEVNLFSVMELSQLYFPVLKARSGSIVNVGSLASHLAIKDGPAYTASKSAVYGLTRSLADKWAPKGVRVNMVAPGFIPTRMTSPLTENNVVSKGIVQTIPMKRYGSPEDIGNAVTFLASEKAAYITGISLNVDGGYMLR